MLNNDKFKTITNLSSCELTDAELRLLDKGLLFIPTIKKFPTQEILETRDRIVRNLKLKAYFSEEDEGEFTPKQFETPSSWQPRNSQLEQKTLETISNLNLSTFHLLQHLPGTTRGQFLLPGGNNLKPDEIDAIRTLKNNREIVIKSADKGGAIVVMDKSAYITEANRQLNNIKYYKKLANPIFKDNINKIYRIDNG